MFESRSLDTYTLTMKIRSGHPTLLVLYQEVANLTDQTIENEFRTKEANQQKVI